MANVLEKSCDYSVQIDPGEAVLKVELGWDHKDEKIIDQVAGRIESSVTGFSNKSYDLNLAAIIEYSDGTAPKLIFHGGGHQWDEARCVILGQDDRTGYKKGVDENLTVNLKQIPDGVKQIVLFVNMSNTHLTGYSFVDVHNVFVQVQASESRKVYFREEEAFSDECAKGYSSYVFAALKKENDQWVLKGVSRYSDEDSECDTLQSFMQK